MNATLEKIENSEAHFKFSIEAEKFEIALEKSFKKNVNNYKIPGFRKGKVTRAVLESKMGPEVLYQDALDFVVPEEYAATLKELDLNPVGDPDIEVGSIEKGKPLSIKVSVPITPEVTLGTIEGLEVKVPKTREVTDKDIERYLEGLRSRNKKVRDKLDESALSGDTLTIDYKCTVEDTTYDDVLDYKFMLDLNNPILGFEDHLLGAQKGDSLNIENHFPADYSLKQLAGKKARFIVTVKKVEDIQLRELDDQFAQEVGKVQNLKELRLKAKRELDEMASLRSTNLLRQAIIKAMLEKCEVTVPEFLVLERAKDMLDQLSKQLAAEGGDIDLYLQMTRKKPESFKKQMWEEAKNAVKTEFILDKIIKEKDFQVSEEELDQGAEVFASQIGMDKEDARKNLGPLMNKVLFELKAEKAIQYVIDHAKIAVDQ